MKALGMALMLWSGTRQSEVSLPLLSGVASCLAARDLPLRFDHGCGPAAPAHRRRSAPVYADQTTSQSGMFIATLIAGSLGEYSVYYNPMAVYRHHCGERYLPPSAWR